ncbi:MAG: conjugal transfer protein TraR [Cupriavidus sp.]|nr:conjugal transfer protein TraR [Cupriavidus sp.]
MRALTSEEITALSVQLDEEERRIHAAVGSGATQVTPPIAPDPGDQTDIADREIVQLQSDALLEHYRMQLSDIAAARARMDIGTYGICSACQTPITFERLAAYPTATRCSQCLSLPPQNESLAEVKLKQGEM